ncbi:MAG: DNA-directed RNA polymerase subunit omega [Acidimicrobiia bacterium]|nr:DNA-directed RNA polymerase subunit omega [Acidimicrobiia bacterium]
MDPAMEVMLENAGSKFTLVTLSSKRAREINDYYNQLGEGLGRIVPPQITSTSRKPLSIALEEIYNGDIIAMPLEETEQSASDLSEIEAAGESFEDIAALMSEDSSVDVVSDEVSSSDIA